MQSDPESGAQGTEVPSATDALHGSVARRFRRGLSLGLPVFLGYLPVGVAFGILAGTLGFGVTQAVLCSATALAGAGQFIALEFLRNGSTAVGVIAASAIVNLRYVLFASTMSTYLRNVPLSTQAMLAFSLTDETFAINIADHRQGLATPASMAGVGAIAWTGWVLGTLIGIAGASRVGDPAQWGVGFAMPAMFTALLLALAENWRHVAIGAIAGALVLGLAALPTLGVHLDPSWHLLIASMGAASIGAVIWRED
jgi:4-azaleucine resistance transporter AzlC